VASFESYKNIKGLDFFPEAQKKLYIILWLNLDLKPLKRVKNKRLDLGQASAGA